MDVRVRWLLQEDIFEENLDPLREAILKSGAMCDVVKYYPFGSGKYENYFHGDEATIAYGSLELVKQLMRDFPTNIPCAWCNLDNFKCSTYYAYFGRFLVNADYTFLPKKEFERTFYGQSVFVRPDSGAKPFSGHVIRRWDDFDFASQFCEPHIMLVASEPKRINEEWRFVISQDGIVTGCRYMENGKLSVREGVNTDAYALAEKIAKNRYGWAPDPLYVIDIARFDDKHFGLMEVNSFSSSGFYACDVDKIVEAANQQAVEEWEEYYGQ